MQAPATVPADPHFVEPAFTEHVDLAAAKAGGVALFANDEFFAGKENLLEPGRGVFIVDKYTENGKWMDGWESRRKRVPGHDWCLIKLGMPGRIHGFDVDTNHFTGNYPEHAAVDACVASPDATPEELNGPGTTWTELLPISQLNGGSRNLFPVSNPQRWTHVRLRIYPDGGVARFRVHGEVMPDWDRVLAKGGPIDLAAIENGGVAVLANDMYFSHRNNLVMPGRSANMGDGWETKRKRGPGNDWVVVKLGKPGHLSKVEIDTNWFKGNFPDRASLEGAWIPEGAPTDYLMSRAVDWKPVLPESKLEAHKQHYYEQELIPGGPYTHIRLSIYPDGGISRLRLWGTPAGVQA